MISSFDSIIDHKTTDFIKHWVQDKNPLISDIRGKMSLGLTKEYFNNPFNELAEKLWLPKLKNGFKMLGQGTDKRSIRKSFEEGDKEKTEWLCNKSIDTCYDILKSKGFTDEQAISFLKKPSVHYNRVFCINALFFYRSTQTDFKEITLRNDLKDVDYIYLAHHADDIIGGDRLMKIIFLHLKQSHEILREE